MEGQLQSQYFHRAQATRRRSAIEALDAAAHGESFFIWFGHGQNDAGHYVVDVVYGVAPVPLQPGIPTLSLDPSLSLSRDFGVFLLLGGDPVWHSYQNPFTGCMNECQPSSIFDSKTHSPTLTDRSLDAIVPTPLLIQSAPVAAAPVRPKAFIAHDDADVHDDAGGTGRGEVAQRRFNWHL